MDFVHECFTVGKRNYFTRLIPYTAAINQTLMGSYFAWPPGGYLVKYGILHCPFIVFALGKQYNNYRKFVK